MLPPREEVLTKGNDSARARKGDQHGVAWFAPDEASGPLAQALTTGCWVGMENDRPVAVNSFLRLRREKGD
jgi:hypothetical protein